MTDTSDVRPLRVLTLSELDLIADVADPGWNGWTLDSERLVLEAPVAGYEIDLAECRDSAQVLDWIVQVGDKGWAHDSLLAGLVRALRDVLNPQTNLCSFGAPSSMTADEIRARVRHVTTAPRSRW